MAAPAPSANTFKREPRAANQGGDFTDEGSMPYDINLTENQDSQSLWKLE